jgi:hypothetical protein
MPRTMSRSTGFTARIRLLAGIAGLATVGALLAAGPAGARSAARPSTTQRLKVMSMSSVRATGSGSALARLKQRQGYLVPDQAAYERAKAEADARAGAPVSSAGPRPLAPATFRSWEGQRDTSGGPSDSTGAVGTTRYVELVNSKYGIYNRTSNSALASGTLMQLVGTADTEFVFDPQILWDPDGKRFYYATDWIFSPSDNRLTFGFSRTASPSNGTTDWCKYYISYGAEFPDYPKLGDNRDLALIGANTFTSAGAFRGSDLFGWTKPANGSITTCPDPSTFTVSVQKNLKNANGTAAFTPVPANQTDKNGTGWAVARPTSLPTTTISVYKVTKDVATDFVKVAAAKTLTVPSYSLPANAQQPGTTNRLDSLDTRMTQAVSAIDPRFGTVGVWTQHTVSGGAGAEVRWYEINPSTAPPSLLQFGTQTSATLYTFNGAISPDRLVSGATKLFGSNMVLDFNTSSTAQFADIRMVSKIGAGAVSSAVVIKASTVALKDFTCSPQPCRWGDYAAATPDPRAPTGGATGQVWGTSQFVKATGSAFAAGWGSWNFAATP